MSGARDKVFRFLCLLSPVLGLAAGGVLLTFQTDWPVPLLDGPTHDLDDDQRILWAGIAVAVVLTVFILAWLLSLDENRSRRPRLWLLLLGLGPGGLLGAGVGLTMSAIGMSGQGEVMAGAIAAGLVSSVVALLPDLFGSILTGILIALARNLGMLNAASTLLRVRRRLAPQRKGLRLETGLVDYHRKAFELALPLLKAEYAEGERSAKLLAALYESAWHRGEGGLVIEVGEELLAKPESMPKAAAEKVRRRLKDLYEDRERWKDVLRMLEPVADRTNPIDLEQMARALTELEDFEPLQSVMKDLEMCEAPPRPRTEELYKRLTRNIDKDRSKIALQYAEYLGRIQRRDEEARILETVLSLDTSNDELRDKIVDIYRAALRHGDLLPHLRYIADGAQEPSQELVLELIELLLAATRYDELEERAARAAKQWPASFRLFYLRSQGMLGAADFEEALVHADRALGLAEAEEDEKKEEAALALKRKIVQTAAKQQLKDLEEHCALKPEDIDARLKLVDLLVGTGRAERATTELESLVSSHPDARDRVLEHLERVVEGEKPPFMLLQYLADLNLARGDLDEVHSLYEKMSGLSFDRLQTLEEGSHRVLERDENHCPTLLRMYAVSNERQQWREAAEYLRRSLGAGHKITELDEKAEAFQCFVGDGDLENGLKLGQELHAAEQFNVRWMVLLAQLYIRNDRFEEALEQLARAKELEPGNKDIAKLLNDTRRRQRESRILVLRERLNDEPENGEALEELGDLLMHFDRHEEAIRQFQKAAQTSDDEDDRRRRYTKLALMMMKRRMFDTTLETLREVPLSLREDKASMNDRKRIFYEVAEELESNNRNEEALELYKQVFKVDAGFRHVMDKMERLGA